MYIAGYGHAYQVDAGCDTVQVHGSGILHLGNTAAAHVEQLGGVNSSAEVHNVCRGVGVDAYALCGNLVYAAELDVEVDGSGFRLTLGVYSHDRSGVVALFAACDGV